MPAALLAACCSARRGCNAPLLAPAAGSAAAQHNSARTAAAAMPAGPVFMVCDREPVQHSTGSLKGGLQAALSAGARSLPGLAWPQRQAQHVDPQTVDV